MVVNKPAIAGIFCIGMGLLKIGEQLIWLINSDPVISSYVLITLLIL